MRTGVLACLLVGVGAVACKIPDTLGLPCTDDGHCDAGQSCGAAGTCVAGDGASTSTTPTTGGPSTDPSTGTTEPPTTGSGTTTAVTTSSEGGGESSTTGPACGQAIGLCDAVDVLFVVDNSGSMQDEFAAFIPALAAFTDLLETAVAGPCSFHLGITTTETAPDFQPEACQVRGALSRSGALLGGASCFGDDEHPPFLDENDDLNAVGCLFAVGQNYDDDEKQLDTALAALSPELVGPGGCNEGFLRPDAALIVVFITDEDDDDDSLDPLESPARTGSMGDPSDWFERLGQIKPATATGVLALLADTPTACDPWMPFGGQSDGEGAEYGERILTFMQYFSGAGLADHIHAGNICSSTQDLVPQIADLVEVLQAVCTDAEL